MTAAYDRRYELTLAKPPGAGFVGFSGIPTNALRIRGAEIKFKVERTLEPTPNSAEIEVYNLAPATKAEFQKRPLHIRLDVGYARDKQLARLIEGDLILENTRTIDADVITKFMIGDGERAYVEARISRSFSSGVNLKTAVKEVAASMGLTVPTSAANASEFLRQFGSGLTLRGPSRNVMTKLIADTGFGWSTQDGALQLLRNTDTRSGLAELISPAFGLVSSPEYSLAKEPGKPPILKFKCLLRPQIIPGGRVKIESADINGVFRVVKVTHAGDFRDNDWYSDAEATPL